MINRKSTFFLGIFVLIVPFLGVPSSWRTVFIVFSGIALIVLSIKITLPKRNVKSRIKKERATPVFVESIPVYPKVNMVDNIAVSNSKKPEEEENVLDQNRTK